MLGCSGRGCTKQSVIEPPTSAGTGVLLTRVAVDASSNVTDTCNV